MEIEPIFSDENWKNFIKDLKNIKSEINIYGNKIQIAIPIKKDPNLNSYQTFNEYISILESIIKLSKNSLKNHTLSFSVNFNELINELIPEESIDEEYKELIWKHLLIMNVCLLRVYTFVVEDHFFQAPLLQINSVRMHPEKEYPINFTCKIMNEDMANAYKYVPKK